VTLNIACSGNCLKFQKKCSKCFASGCHGGSAPQQVLTIGFLLIWPEHFSKRAVDPGLAGLVLCFIACFILLVIAPSPSTEPQPSGGDNKCRLDIDDSGVSPSHCSPCYVSSSLNAGDRFRASRTPAPDTAAEVMQLPSYVTMKHHLERAALSGCSSIIKPTTTSVKPVRW